MGSLGVDPRGQAGVPNFKQGAVQDPGKRITLIFKAATDGKQYRAVAIDATGNFCGKIAGAADKVIGFLAEEGIVNEQLPVMVNGITFAVAASAIAAGDKVSVADAEGRLKTETSDDNVVGYALTATTGTDEILSVLIV